jgi:NCS1 family nucleobase:cation symporter-1
VLIADYWVVRRRRLLLEDLYLVEGAYRGWNLPAVIATLSGCALSWAGPFAHWSGLDPQNAVVQFLDVLYSYAWFVGFGVGFTVHVALMHGRPLPETHLAKETSR